jgi:hypothetical protein
MPPLSTSLATIGVFNDARIDAIDPDILLRVFERRSFGQPDHAMLGGDVGGHIDEQGCWLLLSPSARMPHSPISHSWASTFWAKCRGTPTLNRFHPSECAKDIKTKLAMQKTVAESSPSKGAAIQRVSFISKR